MLNKAAIHLVLITFAAFSSLPVFADELGNQYQEKETGLKEIISIQKIPDLDLEIIHLKNGMVVFLKSNDFENETTMRLTAKGGFSSLPYAQRASGELSANLALRSGLGDYTFDQLQALLYEHSIELNVVINPFSRVIEGSTIPGEIEALFKLINLYFAEHHFSQHSFRKTIGKAKLKIENRSKDIFRYFEDICLSFNSQNFSPFTPLTTTDLGKADLHTAQKFFNQCIADPSHFVCVIAGPFDLDKVRPLVVNYLGAIPKNPQMPMKTLQRLPHISKGMAMRVVEHFNCATSMTKLTFPIQVDITEDNIGNIESIARLVKIKIKNAVKKRLNESIEVQVLLKFPLSPSLKMPWLTIQYLSDPKFVDPIRKTILSELKNLQNIGAGTEEIATLQENSLLDGKLSSRDNYFWTTILSNYSLRGWNPENISKNYHQQLDKEQATKGVSALFSLDHYTIISTHP